DVTLASPTLSVNGVVGINSVHGNVNTTLGSVSLGATASTKGLSIRTGVGDTKTTLAGAVTINGGMIAMHGEGFDELDISGDLNVNGSVSLSNGIGGSLTTFAGVNTLVTGGLMVTALEGFDTFVTSGANFTVNGPVSLLFGAGGSSTTLGAATAN